MHNKEDILKKYLFLYKWPCHEHAHLADRLREPDTNNTAWGRFSKNFMYRNLQCTENWHIF